jgi:hypothetical protein
MDLPSQIYGIDFSGALEAGKWIWISRVSLSGGNRTLDCCCRGDKLPGSGLLRSQCLPAIAQLIAKHGSEAAFGFDFPFGLPSKILGDRTWDGLVRSFATEFSNCDLFRSQCRELGKGRELKRLTDKKTRAPHATYNLRLYRQTYFGIRDIIGPLLLGRGAWFAPMEKQTTGRPCVLEICPASTLKDHHLYYSGSAESGPMRP